MKHFVKIIVLLTALSMTSIAFANLEPYYVKVEQSAGCGATGQPVWASTASSGSITLAYNSPILKRYAVPSWFPNTDIDAVRTKVKCASCTLYGQSKSSWSWYDPYDAGAWETWGDIDLGGYHATSGSDYYYRGEEKYDLCNDDYTSYEGLMRVRWRYSALLIPTTWEFIYPSCGG